MRRSRGHAAWPVWSAGVGTEYVRSQRLHLARYHRGQSHLTVATWFSSRTRLLQPALPTAAWERLVGYAAIISYRDHFLRPQTKTCRRPAMIGPSAPRSWNASSQARRSNSEIAPTLTATSAQRSAMSP